MEVGALPGPLLLTRGIKPRPELNRKRGLGLKKDELHKILGEGGPFEGSQTLLILIHNGVWYDCWVHRREKEWGWGDMWLRFVKPHSASATEYVRRLDPGKHGVAGEPRSGNRTLGQEKKQNLGQENKSRKNGSA